MSRSAKLPLLHLLNYSTEAIVFSDVEGIVLYSNPAADKLYGYEKNELIGKHVDIFNSHQTVETEEIVESIKQTGQWRGQLIQKKKDNSTFFSELSVSLIFDDNDNPIGFGSHSRDVTGLLNDRNALVSNEMKYRKLFETSHDAILIHHEGKIIDFNQRFCEIFGYSAREVTSLSISDVVYHDDLPRVLEKMRNNSEEPYPHRGVRKDGQIIHVKVHGGPLKTNTAELRFLSIRDETRELLNEEKIKTSLLEKEVLLKEIYHRTKNNMQVISSLLSISARNLKHKEVASAFNDINQKIQSMSLVHQKLYESKNLSSLRLNEYIRDLLGLLIKSYSGQKTVNLKLELQPVQVNIDIAMSLGLIISELVSNSFKHAFTSVANPELYIRLENENGVLMVSIEDNGPGFSKDIDFRKPTTLGIQTINGIVEQQLGGEVVFKNDNGLACNITCKIQRYRERV